jgi:hypothetical protein
MEWVDVVCDAYTATLRHSALEDIARGSSSIAEDGDEHQHIVSLTVWVLHYLQKAEIVRPVVELIEIYDFYLEVFFVMVNV